MNAKVESFVAVEAIEQMAEKLAAEQAQLRQLIDDQITGREVDLPKLRALRDALETNRVRPDKVRRIRAGARQE